MDEKRGGGMGSGWSWAISHLFLIKTGEKETFMVFIPLFQNVSCSLFSLNVVLADFGNEALLGAPGSQGVFM